jgi:hypothetical protein
MMTLVMLLLLLSDPNGERRARAALETAATAERSAETAYENADLDGVKSRLKAMADNIQTADESLKASGKTPRRNPTPYKFAEQRSHELLIRLADLEHRMDASEREIVADPKSRVQEIHDAWLEGIMSKKR